MKEVNEAYDTITRMRSGGGGQASYGGTQQQYSYSYQQQTAGSGSAAYAQVRQCINIGDLARAEQLLRSCP